LARTDVERTAQLSVLDRLMDFEPGRSSDPSVTLAESVRQAKAALKRDLEALLNTRRTSEPAPEALEEVRHSLYHYGLQDISSLSQDSGEDRARLVRSLEEAITIFEPRLAGVRVTIQDAGGASDPHRRELHFLIEGTMRMDPTPEHVIFDTVLELTSGECRVEGGGGA
jgi:type VI secretion system protein ImpF